VCLEINLALSFLVKLLITLLQEVGALLVLRSSSTFGSHGTTLIKSISFLSHSAIFCTNCSLLIPKEKRAASTYEPFPDVS